MDCEDFQDLREEIFGTNGERDIKKILNDAKLAKLATKFIYHTGLLGQFRAIKEDSSEEEDLI